MTVNLPIAIARGRSRSAISATAVALVLASSVVHAQEEQAPFASRSVTWLISPLVGFNRDKMSQRDRTGHIQTASKTAAEYGLFALVAHPRFALNDFLFFTQAAGDTPVMGNFFYANLYGDPEAPVTWNIGVGYLYHHIEPEQEEIDVHVPLAKLGAILRVKELGLTFNPYLGYAWERINTRHGDKENDSFLYGITVDWRWRMLNINAKYYYQDHRGSDEGFSNVHVRLATGITRHWGAAVRFDYMERSTADDLSVLMGPVWVF